MKYRNMKFLKGNPMETQPHKYLVSAFSLSMLPDFLNETTITFHIKKLSTEEFCSEIRDSINAVGHQSTVDVINQLCNTNIQVNRAFVKLQSNDELVVFQLKERLPEGKVLTREEVVKLLESNKIEFLKLKMLTN